MTRTFAILVAALTVVAFITAPALAQQERGQAGQTGERGGGPAVSRGAGEARGPAGGGGTSSPAGGGPSGGGSAGSGWAGPSSGAVSRAGSGGGDRSVPSRERGGDYSRPNPRGQAGVSTGRTAVPRGGQGDSSRAGAVSRSGETLGLAESPDRAGSFREVPQYSRPRGGRPATGNAVPRSEIHPPGGPGYPGYPSYPYYPPYWGNYWYWYPYGWGYPWYGSFGLGLFYYDPCWWGYPGGCYAGGGYGYGGGYGGGYGYDQSGTALGALRLKIKPRTAQVYVDGYYSGIVDQYDGTFQRLKIATGGHRVEVRLDGYEPLVFEVLIPPFETITYAGELKPKLP